MARAPVALAALALIVASMLAGCGDDDAESDQLAADDWRAQAEELCRVGEEEAIALPLPGRAREVAKDASKRAEIVTAAREGIAGLGPAEGIDQSEVEGYLGELDADVEQLRRIADGGGRGAGAEQLDESAGEAANALELPQCAAFANAIARTP